MSGAVYVPDATYDEVARAFAAGGPALLPIGATEAHGPHLPLHTDVYIALEVCFRVQAALGPARPAVVLAPFAFTVTELAKGFAGTVTLRPETARAALAETIESLGRHGARTVALVNAHLEPAHRQVLADVAAAAAAAAAASPDRPPRVVRADHARKPWALRLGDEFVSGDAHAGRYETSLLLASRFASTVRLDRARALPARPLGLLDHMRRGTPSFEAMGAADAYFGDPAAASVEEGERLLAVLVEMWLATLEEARPSR